MASRIAFALPWRLALAGVLCLGCPLRAAYAISADPSASDIHLELSPRICTLGQNDQHCQTLVHASWRASKPESLCLVILGRSDVRRCWENYAEGTYSVQLLFDDDLTFQLKDPELHNVLASEILRVIREAIRYRHKRREPWNIFD